jgi:hypothetical protein
MTRLRTRLGISTNLRRAPVKAAAVIDVGICHLVKTWLDAPPGNIAYVALNGFDDDTAAKEWDQHWSEISKANSLIL